MHAYLGRPAKSQPQKFPGHSIVSVQVGYHTVLALRGGGGGGGRTNTAHYVVIPQGQS